MITDCRDFKFDGDECLRLDPDRR